MKKTTIALCILAACALGFVIAVQINAAEGPLEKYTATNYEPDFIFAEVIAETPLVIPAPATIYVTEEEPEPDPTPPYEFVVTAQDGYIVVHRANSKAVYIKTNTAISAFPDEEQERLQMGIAVCTEDALHRLLEDYGS